MTNNVTFSAISKFSNLNHDLLYFYLTKVKDKSQADKKLTETIEHYDDVISHHIENDRFLLASKLCDYKRDITHIREVLREVHNDSIINRQYYKNHAEYFDFLKSNK